MEATDTSRLVCVVVVSYQEYSLTHTLRGRKKKRKVTARTARTLICVVRYPLVRPQREQARRLAAVLEEVLQHRKPGSPE